MTFGNKVIKYAIGMVLYIIILGIYCGGAWIWTKLFPSLNFYQALTWVIVVVLASNASDKMLDSVYEK